MEEEKKVYTISDIAGELGVSTTTVSRAISGKGRISAATRDRVLRFIEEHDYRPNSVARGLAQRKTYNLGLLLPQEYSVTEFPFFKDCMNGIYEVASGRDYDMIVSMVEEDELESVKRLIANGKVDGLILSRSIEGSRKQQYLKENGIPFVVIGPVEDEEIVHVDNQNQEAARELTGRMLSGGLRRIALFGGKSSYQVTGSRFEGFRKAHEERGIPMEKELVMLDVENREDVSRAVEKAVKEQADGILCMDDLICGKTVSILQEKKILYPEQLALASLYDSEALEDFHPPVTGVRFDAVQLGRWACTRLLNLLGEELEEEKSPLNYQIIERNFLK